MLGACRRHLVNPDTPVCGGNAPCGFHKPCFARGHSHGKAAASRCEESSFLKRLETVHAARGFSVSTSENSRSDLGLLQLGLEQHSIAPSLLSRLRLGGLL